MRRLLAGLLLTLAGIVSASAQVTNPLVSAFRIGTGGACATTACTSATKQLCRNSTTDTTIYACDPVAGFYEPVASTGGVFTHDVYDTTAASGPIIHLTGSSILASGASATIPLLQAKADFTMADPVTAPTIGTPTGVSGCLGTKNWTFRAVYYNHGGVTGLSPATSNQTGWATSKNIPVIRPSDYPPTATHWSPAFTDVTAAPSVVRNCSSTGPVTAIGTSSVSCGCSGSGTDITSQVNTTAEKTIFQVMDGELRFPSFASSSPNLLTEGARRFNFGLGYASFTPDSGTTLFDLLTSNGQSRIVCATCRYTTVDLALASISDNAVSKPYTIYALPGTYGGFTMSKSYVYVVGLGTRGSVLFTDTIFIAGDITGAGLSNLYLTEPSPTITVAESTVPTVFHITDSIIGSLESGTCSTDTLHDGAGGSYSGRTWYSSGNLWQTCFDGIFLGEDARFISSGDTFIGDNTNEAGSNNITMFNWLTDTSDYEISGATILITQAKNVSGSTGVQVFNSITPASGGGLRPRLAVTGSRIYVQSTHASTTGPIMVLDLTGADTTTINPEITFNGVDIDMVAAGTTADLIAFIIDADADHDGWTVNVVGGSIRRSGGDTANSYDVDNAETAAGFTVNLYGVAHEGKVTGAGTTNIFNSPLTSGVIRNTPLAAAPATCSIGDRYTDTSGADCYCSASNTWQITNATGACA